MAINPIREGTGLKIKTIEALEWSVPVVASPCGAAGLEPWLGPALRSAISIEDWTEQLTGILQGDADALAADAHKTALNYQRAVEAQLEAVLALCRQMARRRIE